MTKQYQDFGDGGDSKSSEKLKALNLPRDMTGKRFLDLGCNAGFFCIEAAKRGATCVGIEAGERWFVEAVKNSEESGYGHEIEFIHGGWAEEVPKLNERFDYILWASAIHYEKNQRSMMEELAKRLSHEGVLILECGMIEYLGYGPVVTRVTRGQGSSVAHFSLEYLRDNLTKGLFSTKVISSSVKQEGDRISRWVVNCYQKKNSIRIIEGISAIGKTNHSVDLARATNSVLLRADDYFSDLFIEKNAPISEHNASEMRECFNEFNEDKEMLRIDQTVDHLIKNGHTDAMAEMFVEIVSTDYDYVFEGYLPQPLMDALKSKLVGWEIWETTRPA